MFSGNIEWETVKTIRQTYQYAIRRAIVSCVRDLYPGFIAYLNRQQKVVLIWSMYYFIPSFG